MKVKIKFQLGSSLMEFPAPFPLINCNYSFFHLNISSIFYSGTVSSDDRHLVLSRLLNSCFLFNRWGTRYLETSRKYRFCLRPHKCALLLNHVTMTQHFHFSISCGFLLFYHNFFSAVVWCCYQALCIPVTFSCNVTLRHSPSMILSKCIYLLVLWNNIPL
jgi:hypothetical protein